MSRWLREKAERNRQALARLSKRLPTIFPPAVLARALGRPFIPPTPRLAIKSSWRAHPIRADRLARALAARTGPPVGWTWRISQSSKAGLPATFRTPPAPYRERAHRLGRAIVESAASLSMNSAGTEICGTPVQTRTQYGTVPALLPGNSGMHRIVRQKSSPSPPRAALWPNRQTAMEERRG